MFPPEPFRRTLPASRGSRARGRRYWASNNSMEPTWPAGSRCQRLLIDSGLPAGVSFLVARSYEQPAAPKLLVSAQAALPAPARRLISRSLGGKAGSEQRSLVNPLCRLRGETGCSRPSFMRP